MDLLMMTDYTLTRSKRKTLALYIHNGTVEVRAPLKTPKHDIDRFVASKEKWITDKLAQYKMQKTLRDSFTLSYGDMVTIYGKQYPIAPKDGNRVGFDGERLFMPPGLPPEEIKAACIQIFRVAAKRHLTDRAHHFAKQVSSQPTAVKINGAKTRWGSCSGKKSLNFSWRLIMADDDVIDYVVVHELAHIAEMNHSKRFWAIVEDILPDYRERKARLAELQRRLNREDWD